VDFKIFVFVVYNHRANLFILIVIIGAVAKNGSFGFAFWVGLCGRGKTKCAICAAG